MSHELRTPLNSLLILAQAALRQPRAEPRRRSRSSSRRRSTRRAATCSNLINDILDLSKVEAGKMDVDVTDVGARRGRASTSTARSARSRREGARRSTVDIEPDVPRDDRHRRAAPAAGAQEPALERVQVHRAAAPSRCASPAPPTTRSCRRGRSRERRRRRRLRGHRHGHRHPRGQAAADLRGVPAGGRDDEPPLRRHRPRPVDQPRDRAPARRRDPRRARRRARDRRSRSTCRCAFNASRARGRRCAADARALGDRRRAPFPIRSSTRRSCSPASVDDDRDSIDVGRPRRARSSRTTRRSRRRCSTSRASAASRASSRSRGDAGLALAHEYKPDAIVLDMQLPGMDGWAVLDHLKRHPTTRHIPVHVVTGAENGKQRRPACRSGGLPREARREVAARRGVLADLRLPRPEGREPPRRRRRERSAPGPRPSCSATARTSTSPRSARARKRSPSSSRGRTTAWCST